MLWLSFLDGILISLRSDTTLGLQMKSVGEVMSIGRSFRESSSKACQSLEIRRNGLGRMEKITDQDKILYQLKHASGMGSFHL